MSYFGEQESYVLNHLRSRKLRDNYLITTDYGSWAYLTDKEYKQLKNNNLGEPLFSLLKEKGIILNKYNAHNVIIDYRKKCLYLFQGTSLHIVVPTLRCNLKCIYCHSVAKSLTAKGYDMDKETAKKTVEFIFQSPSRAITIEFQGGEPLLRFDLVKYIVKYAKQLNKKYKKNLKFSLVTNLTLMNNDILKFLMSHVVGICTSLDGCKLVHNKNRQEYDKTVY
ncbi:MAG: radical SAM protein, partial [Candidatus Thorarchaeota archaeon]